MKNWKNPNMKAAVRHVLYLSLEEHDAEDTDTAKASIERLMAIRIISVIMFLCIPGAA